jgi:hypothetical protein
MLCVKRRLMFLAVFLVSTLAQGALTVPMEVRMPGTQPEDGVVSLNLNDDCHQCHLDSSDTDPVNIVSDWRGSMMSHAGRDPIFWATMAIAEQDFDGSGDLCLRCHTMGGWLEGESTPTDGSAISAANAAEGVSCEVCHKMTNPDNSEIAGLQVAPFIANDGVAAPDTGGYYGSAQLSILDAQTRLGPYADANASHSWQQSLFHRDVDFCGSCHDVSNPVVGDLAHNHGAQLPLTSGFDGQLDSPGNPRNIEDKAAFNHFPYEYGVVERTFSEYKAGLLSQTRVALTADTGDLDYGDLPAELKVAGGSIDINRQAALGAGTGGDYADGTPRYFSCQTCHMPATNLKGCSKKSVSSRSDQPMHDLTGGNYWMPDAIQYMDTNGTLLKAGGISADENGWMDAGAARARATLESAASLSVTGNSVRVVNLTGHKLISGYPEGRRMWLKIEWYDVPDPDPPGDIPIHVDGDYGPLQLGWDVNQDGEVDALDKVDTILDLDGTSTRIYEAHGAVTKEWAAQLIAISPAYGSVPVEYDRVSGAPVYTLAQVAAQPDGTYHETFHFVLNNQVVKDNRIPPYGMDYDEAMARNILPVPATQYGNPGSGGAYNYWDELVLTPPAGAVSAIIRLMYQPTSYEYINFLYQANNGSVAYLANEGANLLDAWLNTGMAAPHTMATTTWTSPDSDGDGVIDSVDNCPNDANTAQENNDADAQGDICDDDDDNDGLTDTEEGAIGTDPFDADSDDDSISDYDETLFNTIAGYQIGEDTDPNKPDTDADGLNDNVDPIPLLYNFADGDVVTNGSVDAGDLLYTMQIVVGLREETDHARAHVDLYPPGAPDAAIDLRDYVLLLQLLLTN